MSSSENTVTIYQNGIAAFERMYDVKDVLEIKLPFKKDSIGDVAATLSILGPVQVTQAPNYSPNKEKPALEIDPTKVNSDLLTKLSGAQVTINLTGMTGGTVKGRVVGYQTENNVLQNGQQTTQHFLTVMQEDKSLKRLNFNSEVANYTFTDPTVQTLIGKSLDYNVEKMNPESIFMNCTVKAEKPTKVQIRYAIPSPAFKLTYRLRQGIHKDWKLHGYGIVDNNTDEDWINFNVNCATGQPITFATDIADIRIPTRQKINLVNDAAIGAVETESGLESFSPAGAGGRAKMNRGLAAAPMMASTASFGAPADYEEATQAVASSVEVGDSTIFKGSEPVTIPAKKSALVKIIDLALKEAIQCLYYQPAKNERLMRAVKITNEATFTLGRGAVAIEQGGSHVGSAILSLSKPSEQAMLIYAQETGVKVIVKATPEKKTCQKHTMSESVMVTEWRVSRSNTYTFTNVKEENFTLYFDYQNNYSGNASTLVIEGAKEASKLKDNASRYTATIPAKGTLTVSIAESNLTHTTVKAGEFLEWMHRNPDSPLLKTTNLQEIIKLNKNLESIANQINATNTKLTSLKTEQDRIRKNCETFKGGGSQAAAQAEVYMNRLVNSDDEIHTIEHTTLPKLDQERIEMANRIREAVARCTAGWTAPADDSEIRRVRKPQRDEDDVLRGANGFE